MMNRQGPTLDRSNFGLRIRKIPDVNLVPKIGNPDYGFECVPLNLSKQVCRYYLRETTIASWHISLTSLYFFIILSHHAIQC